MGDVPGHHGSAGGAVIDEHAGLGRPETQHHLLAGSDVGQRSAAQSADGRVEVDVVQQNVAGRVDQRQLHVVALVDHDHGPGHGTVEGKGPHEDTGRDLDLLLLDLHADFDDPGFAVVDLLVLGEEGRSNQFLGNALQCADVLGLPRAGPFPGGGDGGNRGLAPGAGGRRGLRAGQGGGQGELRRRDGRTRVAAAGDARQQQRRCEQRDRGSNEGFCPSSVNSWVNVVAFHLHPHWPARYCAAGHQQQFKLYSLCIRTFGASLKRF